MRIFVAIRDMLLGAFAGVARMVGQSMSSNEDEPRPRVVPMPGPAHGPVPAIELRLADQRKAGSASGNRAA